MRNNGNYVSSSFERDSLYVSYKTSEGTEFSASSDASGDITGTNCQGTVSETGYVDIAFSVDVAPDSIRYDYNEVEVVTVPAAPGGLIRQSYQTMERLIYFITLVL